MVGSKKWVVRPQTRKPRKLSSSMPAKIKRQRWRNNRSLVSVSNNSRAHQNPPNPEARTAATRKEEERGGRLKSPLKNARIASTSDIRNSGDFIRMVPFFATSQAAIRESRHSRAENKWVLSPGTRISPGHWKDNCTPG